MKFHIGSKIVAHDDSSKVGEIVAHETTAQDGTGYLIAWHDKQNPGLELSLQTAPYIDQHFTLTA